MVRMFRSQKRNEVCVNQDLKHSYYVFPNCKTKDFCDIQYLSLIKSCISKRVVLLMLHSPGSLVVLQELSLDAALDPIPWPLSTQRHCPISTAFFPPLSCYSLFHHRNITRLGQPSSSSVLDYNVNPQGGCTCPSKLTCSLICTLICPLIDASYFSLQHICFFASFMLRMSPSLD